MNYSEAAAWTAAVAAVACLALALRYRALYLDGREQVRIYDQVISRIDLAFGKMHLSLLWRPELTESGQWTVQDPELKTPRYGPPYLEQLAADENWTIAVQNAVHVKQRRLADTQPIPTPPPAAV